MPDITVLPLLSDLFKVSTDQLLGLKPLDGETYIPEKQPQRISGIKSWNIFCEHEKIIGMKTTPASSYHRSGRLINRSPCWTAAAAMDFWDCYCFPICQREVPIRELILQRISFKKVRVSLNSRQQKRLGERMRLSYVKTFLSIQPKTNMIL